MLATLGSIASQGSVPDIININQTIPIDCSFGSDGGTGRVSASGAITIVSYAPKTGQIVITGNLSLGASIRVREEDGSWTLEQEGANIVITINGVTVHIQSGYSANLNLTKTIGAMLKGDVELSITLKGIGIVTTTGTQSYTFTIPTY